MAQHRTKRDKQVAQIRREQQLYSLSALKTSDEKKALSTIKLSTKSVQPTQAAPHLYLETQYLSQDLRRTLLSSLIVIGALIGLVFGLN